ncbi:branched-chain amino acid aminotransferase 2, chloroplastic-like [Humulus lupulus]|uniref:branched-chain amino acid aminotransferase 2, chloroplastic-like n=1 Tax=Humulus lupulus TaxID=3486 RepID=UPI002B404C62|nr:branched-chain amino acid aminotransferase 2, chloroplastic-like [Humulus lupulus]
MYMMKCSNEENFLHGKLIPYGNIELSPVAGVLNYGQGLFEGLKAYRREDGGIQLFRPEQNALRMKMGAERLCMQSPSVDQFIDAVKHVVIANKRFVPPAGKGALYVRPLLMASAPHIGMNFTPEFTFLVFSTPVGYFYKGRPPFDLFVEKKLRRAVPGGTGSIKSIANYAPVILAQAQATAKGFSDVLFLDSVNGKYVEEVASCNIFMVKGNVVSTPALHGTILPGITRKSIIDIALSFGYQVEERMIPVEELLEADEVFCTGTAVIVNPVSTVTYENKRVTYNIGKEVVSHKLYETLTGIQTGRIEDSMGWTLQVNVEDFASKTNK